LKSYNGALTLDNILKDYTVYRAFVELENEKYKEVVKEETKIIQDKLRNGK